MDRHLVARGGRQPDLGWRGGRRQWLGERPGWP